MTEAQHNRNQNLLRDARRIVLQRGGRSSALLQHRLNPSDPMFPIAYRRLDKNTLTETATALGEVYGTPQSSQCSVL
jgi:hypothetical protein